MKEMSFAAAIREALSEEMERDPTVFVMGQDVGEYGGVFTATKGLYERFGADRVRDTPISETFIAGGAVGAALTGTRPVAELQYADFIAIAMDEIYNKAAKWRYMHGSLFSVPLVIRAAEGAFGGAGPEHSQCPEHLLMSASGLHVVIPSTPADAKGLLKSAIRDNNPVVFLEHKALYRKRGPVPDGDVTIPIGVADIKRSGTDLTVVAWGAFVDKALHAADELAEEGIELDVVDTRGVRPLDLLTVLESLRNTGRLLIAHESPLIGGVGGEISAAVQEEAWDLLRGPIRRIGAKDIPIPQSAKLEKYAIPSAADISTVARQMCATRVGGT